MAPFASEVELETFLGRLDPDYGQYASAVWQNGVRTAHQLANADKEDLVAAGVTSAIHAKDVKARPGPQGQLLTTASCICGLTFHYHFCTSPILRDLQLFNRQYR